MFLPELGLWYRVHVQPQTSYISNVMSISIYPLRLSKEFKKRIYVYSFYL